MMQVEIISEVNQGDGRKAVQSLYTTGLNDSVSKNYLIADTLNSLDYIKNKEPDVLGQLKQDEINHLEGAINSGSESIEAIVSGLKYLTLNEALTEVVGRGVSLSSVYRLINLKSITDYTQANLTNEQLSSVTGYDLPTVELYYSRVATALTCVDALNELEGNIING